jgi:hypothetical protein
MYPLIFISALVAANLSVAMFGPWVSPINAFLLIGLDLSLRDKLHDRWNGDPVKIGSLIGIAGLVSFLINPASGMIAIASVCAFCASMVVDSLVYQKMKQHPWFTRANTSNMAGAATDSLIFPTIAFGGFLWHIVLLQFTAKVIGGLVWCFLFNRSQKNVVSESIR